MWLDLAEAASHVADGVTLALGGLSLYRRPCAFARALTARTPPPRDLTLVAFTAGYESDLLVGAGCVRAVRTCYFGLDAFGLAPRFTEAANSGAIEVIEESEASLVCGLRAKAGGVGFLPSTAWHGTDLPRLRPDVKTTVDPYSGETLTAFPALHIDVAVLHGLEGDADGNVTINNNLAVDMELIYAADTVIFTVERKVEAVRPALDRKVIAAPGADFIALTPNGAWPTSCHPCYPMDGEALMRYVD